jgi:hypothetical protein
MANTILAPWDDDPTKRMSNADYYVDMEKIEGSENILVFIRDKDGTRGLNSNILVIKPPKCHIVLLSGVDPKYGIKLDEKGCIYVRN